tara:strand:+ start:925 stop:1314 length:390 start_codon:yes stop_codon:yes gene_type:complete
MTDLSGVKQFLRDNVSHEMYIDNGEAAAKQLQYGDYLISGLTTKRTFVLCYVVQVRVSQGDYNSNLYFIRDEEGGLQSQDNQDFWKLTPEQIKMVKPLFKFTPEEELKSNPEMRYNVKDKLEVPSFIVR